ncbi:MAG: UDP-N-acetylmuramoyl-L-alanine--D-glutamate ligase [Clostridiales bacterium]|nr:UDP-N-acetylmuramoyl-L-alanine--D-glutamate ligase [Clostridiales bacterium]
MEEKKTALIVGMAKSGISSAKLLYHAGYRVIINDLKHEIDGLYDALSGIEYEDRLGVPPEALLEGVDLMVLSPVIPIFRPFVRTAMSMGIEVIGEIELGYRYCDRGTRFVCIGGTNGKTTTTALTGEIFKADCEMRDNGTRTFVLGNIGIPITEHALETRAGDTVVAETASLQLESIVDFRANAAGLLNITEDHINRFGSMEAYIAAKMRMFENQTEDDIAVLNADDPIVMSAKTRAKVLLFSRLHEVANGAFVRDGMIIYRRGCIEVPVIPADELGIPGGHNLENALCAVCLSLGMGVHVEALRKVLREFKGVEHRIEFTRVLDGVTYYNDSKGTNPESTIKAIEAMKQPTVLLLGAGNYDKKSDYRPVFRAFNGKVRAVVVNGSNTEAIMQAAVDEGFTEIVAVGEDFGEMISTARSLAHEGDAVLLSPACASWGMFRDYEQRGELFKQIVNSFEETPKEE